MKEKINARAKARNPRESREKFESRRRGKQKGGREEEKRRQGRREGAREGRREGVELESGGRLLLWPDVNLSKQPQLHSRALPLDCNPPLGKAAADIYRENVRKAQAEVQFPRQRGTVWGRGSDQGRKTLGTKFGGLLRAVV